MTNMQIVQPLLELKDILFSYAATKEQLKEKPLLAIEKLILYTGEKVGIIGDNGSGKSTIVRIILGLQVPAGKVNLFGRKALWGNHYPQLGYIGDPSFCPGFTGLPTGVSVKEVLTSFKAICGIDKEKSSELEEGLGFRKFFEKEVQHLSNGERKKLMIFLALVKQPKLLIADEATDGLDERSKVFIIDKIEEICKKSQMSLLWISHQHYEVARLTDSIYELIDGQLKPPHQKRFNCEIETYPETSMSGKYQDISSKGWLEIAARIHNNSTISNFEIKGKRMQEGND